MTKYEIPELTQLTPAISAIQAAKPDGISGDSENNETVMAYQDWE